MNGSNCPEKQRLADFTSGKLPEEEASSVSQHVSECAACEATVQSLETKSDTLASGLRDAPPKEPYVEEPGYRQAVSALNKLPAGGKPKPPEPAPSPASSASANPVSRPAARPPAKPGEKPQNTVADKPAPKLGPYKLLAKLGEGGMGAVYKALHEHLGKTVAIKVLPKKAMQDQAAVARFRREMKAVGALHHPNIVGAHDAGEAQGVHFLVMEYVEGSDLSGLVKKHGPLPVEKAISYIRQAACGLAFAHGKGVVHRDIKPANLLVDTEGTLKILDMGLARLDDGDPAAREGLTQTGQVMGTVDYMAPEQAFDTHTADGKADVYSLGCTLYRILTGQNMFTADTLVQKILAHREASIPALGKVRPDAPPQLDALYQRMVAKKPEQRPTMAEVASELEALAKPQGAAPASAPALDVVIDTGKAESGKRKAASVAPAASPERQRREPAPASAHNKPPRSPNAKWIAAAAGAAAVIFAAVWYIIRDKDGNELARVKGPDGSSVTAVPDGGANVGPAPTSATTDPVRAAVEYILARKGRVTATVGNVRRTFSSGDVLPPWAVQVSEVHWNGNGSLTAADFAWLEKLPNISKLFVNSTKFDDSCLAYLKGQSAITLMWIDQTELSPAGHRNLVKMLPALRSINIGGPKCTNTTLAQLHDCTQLTRIDFMSRPSATTSGIAALQSALPNCKIVPYSKPGSAPAVPENQGATAAALSLYEILTSPDYEWSPPENLGSLLNSTVQDYSPSVSADGLTLVYSSFRSNGRGGSDIWMARRPSVDAAWETPVNVGTAVNGTSNEHTPFLTPDGLTLLFMSDRPGGIGGDDLWQSTRHTTADAWTPAKHLGPAVNSTASEDSPFLSPDGFTLWFASDRAGGAGGYDIWISRRATPKDSFGPAENLGPPLNTPSHEADPSISSDGRVFLYASRPITSKPTEWDLKLATQSLSGTWSTPVSLPPEVNSTTADGGGEFLADGRTMLFHSRRTGGAGQEDLWMTRRVPKVQGVVAGPSPTPAALRWPLTPSKPEDIRFFRDLGADVVIRRDAVKDWNLRVRDPLPSPLKPGTIVGLDFWGVPDPTKIDDDVLRRVATLTDLETLHLVFKDGSADKLTDAGRAEIGKLTQLRFFTAGGIGGDAAEPYPYLLALPQLERLHLKERAPVGWARTAGRIPTLREIFVYRRGLTDDELQNDLGKLPRLEELRMNGVKCTDEALRAFAAQHPWCRIVREDGSKLTIEPTAPLPGSSSPATASPVDYALFAQTVQTDAPLDLSRPLTLEAYVTPSADRDTAHWALMGNFTINLQCGKTWALVVYAEDAKQVVRADSRIVPVVGRRTHFAGVYTPQTLELYIDGVLSATAKLDGFSRTTKASTFQAGAKIDDQVDEIRVSKSVRYNKNFTPQQRFEPDADTLALYHCDEGAGDVLVDASGNNHHGKIVGAKWVRAEIRPNVPSPHPSALTGLEFTDGAHQAIVDSLKPDCSKPFTFEAYVLPKTGGIILHYKDSATLAAGVPSLQERRWMFSLRDKDANVSSVQSADPVEFGKPVHVASVHANGELTLFLNGTRAGVSKAPEKPQGFSKNPFAINGHVHPFTGIVGQVRVSGTGRYTSDFTPPERFESDKDTLALYHFDEGTGNLLHDASGHGHDGKIVGAKWVRADGSPIPASPSSGAGAPALAVAPFDAAQARAHQQAWATYLGTSVESKNSVDMRMTLVPPGEFLMGSTPEQVEAAKKMGEADKIRPDDHYYGTMPGEMPQHKVRILRPLLMSTTEVTVAQFRKFAETTKYVTVAEKYGFGDGFGDEKQFAAMIEATKKNTQGLNWRAPGKHPISDEHPATQLTWNDAVAFCNWLSEQEGRRPWYRPDGKGGWLFGADAYADGYRLPTEAEWEYACRAGTTTHYSFGDDKSKLKSYGWFAEEFANRTHPVALKQPNPFGLFDMHGNTQEWCHDVYDAKFYEASSTDDPVAADPRSNRRVIRGGYHFHRAADARSAYRDYRDTTNHRHHLVGFRIVRLLELQAPTSSPPRGATQLTDVNSPAFQAWLKATQALTAEKQLEAVSKKLMELNPGFDGKLTASAYGATSIPKIENGVVVDLGFNTDQVENLAPLRALSRLRRLNCSGSIPRQGRLVDLSPLAGLPLTNLSCAQTQVADLSPLKGMPLKALTCNDTQVAELTPLVGMPLTDVRIFHTAVSNLTPLNGMKIGLLYCHNTPVSDLSPLVGMPLAVFNCSDTQVADLTPLKGMPLSTLWFHDTPVSDMTPLAEMSLKSIRFTPANIARGIELLREMPSVADLGVKHATTGGDVYKPAEFWKKYDAGEFGKSATPKKLAYLDPAFQQWVAATQKLSAEQQLEAVSKKLKELNPGFDGKLTGFRSNLLPQPYVVKEVVTEVGFETDKVTDISPVRAFPGLLGLSCSGQALFSGSLTDLSPLTGLPLKKLLVNDNKNLSDLAPLEGLQLTYFESSHTAVTDFTALKGMPLEYLHTGSAVVDDLSFVRGMPLEIFYTSGTLSDLSPLRGMPLRHLSIGSSQVTDLSPLKGMPLGRLGVDSSPVSDLSPLVECKELTMLFARKTQVTAAAVAALQKALPNCKIDWDDPAKAAAAPKLAYLDPSFQQWVADAQRLPAEKQLEAVTKKLMELNPGFDGKILGRSIEQGVVKRLGIVTDKVTDLSPLRALPGLSVLSCNGSTNKSGALTDLTPLHGVRLTALYCRDTQISDLSPLVGMELTDFSCERTNVANLSSLAGMPLTILRCGNTTVKDLLPIKGMQLNVLDVSATQVSDLTPLAGMPLNNLHLGGTRVADLSSLAGAPLAILQCECVRVTDASLAPVAGFKSLRKLSLQGAKVTAAGIATLQKALPECKVEWDDPAKASKLAYLAPSFQQWVAATQKLSAEKQLEAVSKKLMELNPGFDGKLTGIELRPEPKIENEVVVELGLIGVEIIDLSPVRVLTGLKKLGCWGVGAQRAKFADLSPLTGLKLDYLAITGSDASDLTPLQGMPLATLHCAGSRVEDLTPLRGAPLTRLLCKSTRVTDLTPLAGMPLKTFECNGLVADIAPLAGMPLESLSIEQTQATELTPLETCQSLKSLKVSAQRITVEQTAALQKVLPNCKIERIEPKPIAEPAK